MMVDEEIRVRVEVDTGIVADIEQRLRSVSSMLDGIMGEQPGLREVRREVEQLEESLRKAGILAGEKGAGVPAGVTPGRTGEVERPELVAPGQGDRFAKEVPFKRSLQVQEEYLGSIKETVRQQTAEMYQHQRNVADLEHVDELKRRTEDSALTTKEPDKAGAPKGRLSNLRNFASRFGNYFRQGKEEIQDKMRREGSEDRHLRDVMHRPSQLIDRFFRTAGMTGVAMLGGSTSAFYGGLGAAAGAGIGVISRGAATAVTKGTELAGMAIGAGVLGIVGAILKVPGLAKVGADIGSATGQFAGVIAGNVIAGIGEMAASLPGPFGAMAGHFMEQSAQTGMARSDATARLTAMGGGGGMLGTAGRMGYVTEEGAEAAGGFLQVTGGAAGFEGFLRFGRGHGITPEEQLSYAPIFRLAGGTMPGGPDWESVMRMGAGAARRSGIGHARLPEFLTGTTQLAEQIMGQKDVMGVENVQALLGLQALIGRMGEPYQGERSANFLGRINTAITEGGGGGARREFMLQALGYTPGQGLQSRLMAEQRLEEGIANVSTFGMILSHTQQVFGTGFYGQRNLAGLLGLSQEESEQLLAAYVKSPEEFTKVANLVGLAKEDPIAAAMISGAESFAVNMESIRLEHSDKAINTVRETTLVAKELTQTVIDIYKGENVEGHMAALAENFRKLIGPLEDIVKVIIDAIDYGMPDYGTSGSRQDPLAWADRSGYGGPTTISRD